MEFSKFLLWAVYPGMVYSSTSWAMYLHYIWLSWQGKKKINNLTKILFCNLASLSYSYKWIWPLADKCMPKVIVITLKSWLPIHHQTIVEYKPVLEDVFISDFVCLSKTSNSRYKYPGLFLRPKLLCNAQNSQ